MGLLAQEAREGLVLVAMALVLEVMALVLEVMGLAQVDMELDQGELDLVEQGVFILLEVKDWGQGNHQNQV